MSKKTNDKNSDKQKIDLTKVVVAILRCITDVVIAYIENNL